MKRTIADFFKKNVADKTAAGDGEGEKDGEEQTAVDSGSEEEADDRLEKQSDETETGGEKKEIVLSAKLADRIPVATLQGPGHVLCLLYTVWSVRSGRNKLCERF